MSQLPEMPADAPILHTDVIMLLMPTQVFHVHQLLSRNRGRFRELELVELVECCLRLRGARISQ